jgi:hypothetical protein
MKKSGLLSRLSQMKAAAEGNTNDGTEVMQILDLLLDYINDTDIRAAVDEIPF